MGEENRKDLSEFHAQLTATTAGSKSENIAFCSIGLNE